MLPSLDNPYLRLFTRQHHRPAQQRRPIGEGGSGNPDSKRANELRRVRESRALSESTSWYRGSGIPLNAMHKQRVSVDDELCMRVFERVELCMKVILSDLLGLCRS